MKDNELYLVTLLGIVAIVGIIALAMSHASNTTDLGMNNKLGYAYLRYNGTLPRANYRIISSEHIDSMNCSSSDGFNPYVEGYTNFVENIYRNNTLVQVYRHKVDYCMNNSSILKEYACEDGEAVIYYVQCFNGCNNGICLMTMNLMKKDPKKPEALPIPK